MLAIRAFIFFSLAAALPGGIVTSVQCTYRDFGSPELSGTQTAVDGCSISAGQYTGATATASAAYAVDGNTFTMELSVFALGHFAGNTLVSDFSLGSADASAEIDTIWLYTELPATISFSARPESSANSSPWGDARAAVDYYFGQLGGYCGKNTCWGLRSADFVVEPGEAVMTRATAQAVGHASTFYGMGAGLGSLVLTASAWAADGSPVPLFYSDEPLQMGAVSAALLDEVAETPEPATYSIILAGLLFFAFSSRRKWLRSR